VINYEKPLVAHERR